LKIKPETNPTTKVTLGHHKFEIQKKNSHLYQRKNNKNKKNVNRAHDTRSHCMHLTSTTVCPAWTLVHSDSTKCQSSMPTYGHIGKGQAQPQCHSSCNKCGTSCKIAFAYGRLATRTRQKPRYNWWEIRSLVAHFGQPKRSHTYKTTIMEYTSML